MESEMIYARKIEEGKIDENLGRSLASLSLSCAEGMSSFFLRQSNNDGQPRGGVSMNKMMEL